MHSIWRCLAAAAIALGLLYAYDGRHVDADTFGLAPTDGLSAESWDGQTFSASSVAAIVEVTAQIKANRPAEADSCEPFTILWLGNSQLHYVNQFERGDHIAPYWLRRELDCPASTVPLGFSLPNANIQEHYILSRYVTRRVPIRMMLLELCFDDLREDGLRPDFSALLADTQLDDDEQVASAIVSRARSQQTTDTTEENAGLEGFVQKRVEDRLDSALGDVWPLWSHRQDLRVNVLTDLYNTRNAALGITPTTVRRLIPARYDRNMEALASLLRDAREKGIAVVAYVAPIRQDIPIPYDVAEYEQWKTAVGELVREHNARLINLEELIPADLWGSYVGDAVDFMHFRGPGHQILARALLPAVTAIGEGEP
jgi:hypothetical protein